eukprot:CAMPEP_0184517112 /NCGR_PEP_ID=MMETSP0198_2-20121128/5387_1 /TAXON_ID=1112570 /ORGANISM="Thraustochytrium sp., Strain LLF1b" /LENGTH=56 /DNA_ID=CAMNT_0026907475 /DNA_START=289 /DNA_END=459 /DNA_ORIENTATION=-
MSGFDTFVHNYQRRYIRTGSSAPVFHAMGIVFFTGVLIHAKANHDRSKDPKYVPEH